MMRAAFCLTLGMTSVPVMALTPPMPCTGPASGPGAGLGLTEDSMWIGPPQSIAGTGLVVEGYGNALLQTGDAIYAAPAPIPELEDFHGIRVTHCASGEILAFRSSDSAGTVATAIAATEFLRARVQAGKAATAGQMKRAVKALYGTPLVLRDAQETCGCNAYFPALRPEGITPYAPRGT